jgi:hypothetical protein
MQKYGRKVILYCSESIMIDTSAILPVWIQLQSPVQRPLYHLQQKQFRICPNEFLNHEHVLQAGDDPVVVAKFLVSLGDTHKIWPGFLIINTLIQI